jgi:hypothetical protein
LKPNFASAAEASGDSYLDSGVLLAAWKSYELRSAALRVLEGPERQFATSQLTKLEFLPKTAFLRSGSEEFYTSEKPGKPIFRVQELKIISLHTL